MAEWKGAVASLGAALSMADSAADVGITRRRRARPHSLIGFVVSLGCIALIALNVDLAGVLAALKSFRWPYLGIGLLSLFFGYAMRIARWTMMLRATGPRVTVWQSAAPFLGSIALNNVLPLRIGDMVRATVFPAAIGVQRSAAIGSIVLERIIDMLTLLLFLAIGMAALGSRGVPDWLTDGAVVLAVGATGALFSILLFSTIVVRLCARLAGQYPADSIIGRGLNALSALLIGFRQMSGLRTLGPVFALSFLAWLGEAGVFWGAIMGFGIPGGLLGALMITAFVVLSTLVPSSPGYVGPFHLAAIAAVTLLGSGKDLATSFAILSHLMVWLPTTFAGGICMLMRPHLFRGAMARQRAADA